MDTEKLHEILSKTTKQFRKGEEVTKKTIGNVHVTELYLMPHTSENVSLEEVDVHFITVGVDKEKAESYKAELISILKEYPKPERLASGPSYIEIGAVLGSQDDALRLFALGQVLGLWKIITPATMGIEEPIASQLAGKGMVMISGFKET